MDTIVFPEAVVGKESSGAYVRADEARARITELETRLAIKDDAHAASMLVMAKQLARYQGGVEVEGMAVKYASVFPAKFISCNFPDELIGHVRVLVLPEERIVATNNTMEVE